MRDGSRISSRGIGRQFLRSPVFTLTVCASSVRFALRYLLWSGQWGVAVQRPYRPELPSATCTLSAGRGLSVSARYRVGIVCTVVRLFGGSDGISGHCLRRVRENNRTDGRRLPQSPRRTGLGPCTPTLYADTPSDRTTVHLPIFVALGPRSLLLGYLCSFSGRVIICPSIAHKGP